MGKGIDSSVAGQILGAIGVGAGGVLIGVVVIVVTVVRRSRWKRQSGPPGFTGGYGPPGYPPGPYGASGYGQPGYGRRATVRRRPYGARRATTGPGPASRAKGACRGTARPMGRLPPPWEPPPEPSPPLHPPGWGSAPGVSPPRPDHTRRSRTAREGATP